MFSLRLSENARDNIDEREERALKALARELLGYDAAAVEKAMRVSALRELRCDR